MGDIQIQQISVPGYIAWSTNQGGPTGELNLRTEIFTGNIDIEWSDTSGKVQENGFLTYLPMDSNNRIRSYGDIALPNPPGIVSAILVTPIGIQAHEKEHLCAVNAWSLKMQQQRFPNVPEHPNPYVLTLSILMGLMNGVVLRVGYHVTVTTSLDLNVGIVQLDPTDAPHN